MPHAKKSSAEPATEQVAAQPSEPAFISVGSLATRWETSSRTIYRELAAGRLPAVKIGDSTRIPMTAVHEREASLPVATFGAARAANPEQRAA
jgi:excisionase family DNA binding protein